MTPEQLDSAWERLKDRANALIAAAGDNVALLQAIKEPLSALFRAYAAFAVAFSAGTVNPASVEQWSAIYDAQADALKQLEAAAPMSGFTKYLIGVAVVGGAWWMFRKAHRLNQW